MFVNPEHPMYLTEPDAKPSRWFVTRTQAGDYLPVYTEVSRTSEEQRKADVQVRVGSLEGREDGREDSIGTLEESGLLYTLLD